MLPRLRPRRGGGRRAGAAMAALLAARGVALDSVLDEGGAVARGLVPGVERPAGAGRRRREGLRRRRARGESEGGHSSTPPRADGDRHPGGGASPRWRRSRCRRASAAPSASFSTRLAPGARLPLPRRCSRTSGCSARCSSACCRARPAPTRCCAPRPRRRSSRRRQGERAARARAEAVVNFRILPGDTVDDVVDARASAVADERIGPGAASAARRASRAPCLPVDDPAFARLAQTVREIFPDVAAVPLPGARRHRRAALLGAHAAPLPPEPVPVRGRDDLKRAHGTDERLVRREPGGGVRFYRRLIENSAPAQAAVAVAPSARVVGVEADQAARSSANEQPALGRAARARAPRAPPASRARRHESSVSG